MLIMHTADKCRELAALLLARGYIWVSNRVSDICMRYEIPDYIPK